MKYEEYTAFNEFNPQSLCKIGVDAGFDGTKNLIDGRLDNSAEFREELLFPKIDEVFNKFKYIVDINRISIDKETHTVFYAIKFHNSCDFSQDVKLTIGNWKIESIRLIETSRIIQKSRRRRSSRSLNLICEYSDSTSKRLTLNKGLHANIPFLDLIKKEIVEAVCNITYELAKFEDIKSFYKTYIVQLYGAEGYPIGQGVLVGHCLITAGHIVVPDEGQYFYFQSKRYKLDDYGFDFRRVVDASGLEEEQMDFASVNIPEIDSPLKLGYKCDRATDSLQTITYRVRQDVNDSIFRKNKEEFELKLIDTTIKGNTGHFLEAETSECMLQGDSGCPLICNDKVLGILCGDLKGKESTKEPIFQCSRSIIEKYNQLDPEEIVPSRKYYSGYAIC